MKLHFSDLWRWDGSLGRVPFGLWALGLFGVKWNLDRLLLGQLGLPGWTLPDYFAHPIPWPRGLHPSTSPGSFALLLGASLPFLWCGGVLCLKRLRSARLPLPLLVLFVVPSLKWFLFVTLLIAPAAPVGVPPLLASPGSEGPLRRWLPHTRWGVAWGTILVSALVAMIFAILATEWLTNYGWALFAGIPFGMGFFSAVLLGAGGPRTLRQSLGAACLTMALTGLGFLVFAFEGAICLLMAAPLAFALAMIGGLLGHAVHVTATRPPRASATLCVVPLLALPAMLGAEHLAPQPPPLLRVKTSVSVAAPPERVWKQVVEFSELPPPTEWMFRLGIAYPLRAEIRGRGVGAIRHCIFSTGPFVEPITVWDEPRHLAFSVTENPTPMQEWTPYQKVHPPHLEGFLVSRQGEFRLHRTADGGTLLEGTTWYHHSLWPAAYWQVWSDQIIHTIHRRVLSHVKQLAEKTPTPNLRETRGSPATRDLR